MNKTLKDDITAQSRRDFIDYKNMYNGSGFFEIEVEGRKTNIRTRTGVCDNWNINSNNLIALDMSEHSSFINAYVFCIYDKQILRLYTVGWIFFHELLKNALLTTENGNTYLVTSIKELHSMSDLVEKSSKNL